MTKPREPEAPRSTTAMHASLAAALDDATDMLERRFEALALASAPFAPILWTTPADGLVDDMPAWRDFTGQTRAQVRGWGWLDAVHPDDRERAADAWRAALANAEVYDTTFRARRADGVYRLISDRGAPVRDRDGHIREWVGISTDITEAREAERRLQVQHAVSRVLSEGTSFDAVAQGLVETIGDALGWDVGVFWTVDPTADVLRPRALGRATTNDMRPFEAASLARTMSRGVGLPGRVWATGEPAWLVEVLDDKNFPRIREARAAGLHTALAFPVRGPSGILGVIEFFSVRQEPPNDELLRTVTTLGNSIGQFLERGRAEEEVRASHARTRAILQAALDCIITIDADGRIVEFNPAAEATFGYSRDEVLGETLAQKIIPAELRASHRDGLERYLATGEGRLLGRRIETTAMRADGTCFPVELAITRIEWAGPPLFTAYLRDIGERIALQRRTHEALDALLEMAQALVEVPVAAPEHAPASGAESAGVAHRLAELTLNVLGCHQLSIASIDPETDVMRPLALTGFTPEQERVWWAGWQTDTTVTSRLGAEVAGRMHADEIIVLDATAPEHQDRLRPFGVRTLLLVPAFIRGQLIGGLALNFALADADILPETRTMAAAVAKLVGLVIERERLLREREEARASALALEVANRRMNEFLGIVSHELRTPLTTIKANLQLAERRVLALVGDEQRGGPLGVQADDQLGRLHLLLTRASLAIARQERLVLDLLDVSRIQQGKMEMRSELLDLTSVVREIVEEHTIQNADRTITLDLPAEAVYVWADPMRVGQVVTNYLTNALKYSDTVAPVHVSLRREDSIAWLGVTDAGPGLPAAEREHIWEQFHRVPGIEVLSGSGVGLGLGLYISREIIERHGGTVGVESEPGRGSTFWFTLPFVADERA